MAYGLRIKDASGNVKLDTSHRISRLRYVTYVSAGASGSVELADIAGLSSLEFGIAVNGTGVSHTVTRAGTTISWSPNNGTRFSSADTLVYVFLYT